MKSYSPYEFGCRCLVTFRRLLCALALVFSAAGASAVTNDAAQPIITALDNAGRLRWTDDVTDAVYKVEWTSSLQNDWQSSWDKLTGISGGTGIEHEAVIPLFYRVVRVSSNSGGTSAKTLTLDAEHPLSTLTTSPGTEQELCATRDGVVYSLSLYSGDNLLGPYDTLTLGLDMSAELRASVWPPIPGLYMWSAEGANLKVSEETSQKVTVKPRDLGSYVKIKCRFAPIPGGPRTLDADYRERILGTWLCTRSEGGPTLTSETSLNPGGVAGGTGILTAGSQKIDMWFHGRWRVENSCLIIIVDESNVFDGGLTTADRIMSLDGNELRLGSNADPKGEIEVWRRKQ